MQIRSRSLRRLAAGLALLPCAAFSAQPIPIDSFARLPEMQSVSMSADGKNLVALVAAPGSGNKDTALATWSLDNLDKGPVITPSGDRMKFIAASAMKADRVLVIGRQEWTGPLAGCGEGKSTGATKTFVSKVYITDAAQKKFDEAFTDNTRKLGVSEDVERCLEIAGSASLVSTLPLDPDNVIVSRVNPMTFSSNYYLYNLRNGETKLLFKGGGRTSPGLFNPRTGELLTRTELEPVAPNEYEQRILIKNPATGQFEVHEELSRKVSERHTVEVVGLDEESGNYYVLTDIYSDHVQAWLYDPKQKKFLNEPLLAHPQYDITSLILGSKPSNFNRILGFVVGGPRNETTYVDPAMKSIQASLKQAYPNQSIVINGYNNDLSRVLFTSSSAQNPPAYHLLLDRKVVKSLGGQRPWINPAQIGEQRWVTYTARDGLQIPAILDLPAGWKPGDAALPAIVHPHGGPWARDYAGWDASGWVPFLTSRGYAVIRPQYRGSAGLGRKLWLAGDAEWGQKMQDDDDDAADWLVKQGIAAKDRIAIFGYSYGGFAASAAVVRPNSPYQCAIAGAPVTNLAKLGWSWSESRLQRILQGRTVKGMDPMRNTDKANIPLLTYVGDRDVRTPSFHAEDFYNAVKGKVPAKFQLIPDMPHSMPWYYRHQETTLHLIEDFLSKDCGPGGL